MNDHTESRYRWFVLAILSVVSIATVGNIVAPATMLGEIAKTSGLSQGGAGFAAMGMIDLSTGLSGLVGGFAADRFGVGRVWVVSFVLLVVGSLLIPAYGNTFIGLSAIRVLHGCGAGPIIATTPLVAAQWFPPNNRGLVIGVQGTSVSIGAALSLLFVPAVFEATGRWQSALAAMALFSVVGLVMSLVLALGRRAPAYHGEPPPGHGTVLGFGELMQVLVQPPVIAAIVCGFAFSWAVRAFNDLIPNYLGTAAPTGLGFGPVRAGKIMSIVQLAFMVGPLIGGVLVDRVFRGSVRAVIMLGFLICSGAAYMLSLPAVDASWALLMTSLLVCGFAMSITAPQVMTYIVKTQPERVIGKLGGIAMGFSILGGVAGVAACSYALHESGRYHSTILLIAAAPLVGAVASLLLVGRANGTVEPPALAPASGGAQS